jgi:hypothetical protein
VSISNSSIHSVRVFVSDAFCQSGRSASCQSRRPVQPHRRQVNRLRRVNNRTSLSKRLDRLLTTSIDPQLSQSKTAAYLLFDNRNWIARSIAEVTLFGDTGVKLESMIPTTNSCPDIDVIATARP